MLRIGTKSTLNKSPSFTVPLVFLLALEDYSQSE